LVELHALSIDGLNAGLEVEFAANPVVVAVNNKKM